MNVRNAVLVLALVGLMITPAMAQQVIQGPHGQMLSPAQINDAYQHVRNTRHFIDVMVKFGYDRLIYHCKDGWNHWRIRYKTESDMREHSAQDQRYAVNWRGMLIEYTVPFVNQEVTVSSGFFINESYSTGQTSAFVFRTFPESDVIEAKDALVELTKSLEHDAGDPDWGDDDLQAIDTLKERVATAKQWLDKLLRMTPPGNVRLQLSPPYVRPEFAALINNAKPGSVTSTQPTVTTPVQTTTTNNTGGGTGVADVSVAPGFGTGGNNSQTGGGIDPNQGLLGVNPGQVNSPIQQGTGGSSWNPGQLGGGVSTAQNGFDPSASGSGGGLDMMQLLQLFPQLAQQGVKPGQMPSQTDTGYMNNQLNGTGGQSSAFPGQSISLPGNQIAAGGCYDPLNSGGYVIIAGNPTSQVVVQGAGGDRAAAFNQSRNAMVQALMSQGMSQADAARAADQILSPLVPFLNIPTNQGQTVIKDPNNGQIVVIPNNQQGQVGTGGVFNGQQGQIGSGGVFNGQQGQVGSGGVFTGQQGTGQWGTPVQTGPTTTPNQGTTTTTTNQSERAAAQQEIQRDWKYVQAIFPDNFFTTNAGEIAGYLDRQGTVNGQTTPFVNVLINDASQRVQGLPQSNIAKVLGTNSAQYQQMLQCNRALLAALQEYKAASSDSAKAAAIDKIKRAAQCLRQSIQQANTAVMAVS